MSRCRMWVRPSLALAVALAGVPLSLSLAGCGGEADTTVTAEQPPEVQQANNAMEDFMKNQAKTKKGR